MKDNDQYMKGRSNREFSAGPPGGKVGQISTESNNSGVVW